MDLQSSNLYIILISMMMMMMKGKGCLVLLEIFAYYIFSVKCMLIPFFRFFLFYFCCCCCCSDRLIKRNYFLSFSRFVFSLSRSL